MVGIVGNIGRLPVRRFGLFQAEQALLYRRSTSTRFREAGVYETRITSLGLSGNSKLRELAIAALANLRTK
jgi:hypothetical protein